MTALYPGLRSEKITVLMPKSLVEDLRALRLVTGQSTGDLINQLLEAHLEQAQADVEAGRAMLQIREKAQRKGAGADSSGEVSPSAVGAPELKASEGASSGPSVPDAAFIESWAKLQNKPGKCERIAKDYAAWCEAGGHPFGGSSELFTSEVLAAKYSSESVKTYGRFVKRLIEAWEGRERAPGEIRG